MNNNIQLGVIGLGNMGEAIIKALIKRNVFRKEDINAFDISKEKAQSLESTLGINIKSKAKEVARKSKILIIAVKPNDLPSLLKEIKEDINEAYEVKKTDNNSNDFIYPIIISICASVKIEDIKAIIGEDKKIVRVMPNTPFLVGTGASAVAFREEEAAFTKTEKDFIVSMLECGGIVFEVDEKLINPITALSGSSPAFVFMFIEALADGAVRAGLPRDMAMKLAGQTVLGAAKMFLETNKHTGELKDMVSSPAGTTIEGIATLEKGAFRGIVMESVFAAYKKANEL